MADGRRAGPLAGVKVIEMEGIGPVPFAAMMLADMGADVLKITRYSGADGLAVAAGAGPHQEHHPDPLGRGRPAVRVDLTHPDGIEVVLRLVESADALVEGYRPGFMEGLELAPEKCQARNPRLVFGRMTGWGQTGPLAHTAGHDINYIALTGALRNFARPGQPPVPPLNLLADFGGGGMLLAFGVVCGIWEAHESGRGQVIDAAMTDGTALLMNMVLGLMGRGEWRGEPGTNLFDGGAPCYGVYETADHQYVSVGAVEPFFFREMLDRAGIPAADMPGTGPPSTWPDGRKRMAEMFRTRSRDDWSRIFDGSDACVTPVLRTEEAYQHPHNVARGTFVDHDGIVQAAPAPRFSKTPGSIRTGIPEEPGTVLSPWGFDADEVQWLRDIGAVGGPGKAEGTESGPSRDDSPRGAPRDS